MRHEASPLTEAAAEMVRSRGVVLTATACLRLDTYQTERHPVAADVVNNTRAQIELLSTERGPGPCAGWCRN
jgi:hypothetical protein